MTNRTNPPGWQLPPPDPYYVINTEKAQESINQAFRALSRAWENHSQPETVTEALLDSIANALIALAVLHCPEESDPPELNT